MEKKIDKDFILGDSSVNSYGFRMLTSGYMIEEFKKNPIGFFMHADGEFGRNEGVLVRWDELRIEGDSIKAKPSINLEHKRGQRTVNEVNSGFLNGASFGQIVAVEISEDKSLMLPGQTGPTVTKWYNRECSLVDMPSNKSSVILYNKDGQLINLTDFVMGNISLLNTASKSELKIVKVKSVVEQLKEALSKKIIDQEQYETLCNTFKDAPDRLQVALEMLDMQRTDILAAKTFTDLDKSGELEEYKKRDFEGFKNKFKEEFGKPYLGQAPQSENNSPRNFPDTARTSRLAAMTYSELDRSGELEEYKNRDFEGFKAKFFDEFGFAYKK